MRKYSKMDLNTLSRQSLTELIISMRDASWQLQAATPGVVGGAYSTRNLNIAYVIGWAYTGWQHSL